MNKTLYLVRHAQPRTSRGEKHELTTKGTSQARAVAALLQTLVPSGVGIMIGYSPVRRCQQTAIIIASNFKQQAYELPLRLRGANKLRQPSVHSNFTNYMNAYQLLSIESPANYAARILRLVEQRSESTIILVGNEVPIRILLQSFGKTSYTNTIKYGETLQIDIKNGVPKLIGKAT